MPWETFNLGFSGWKMCGICFGNDWDVKTAKTGKPCVLMGGNWSDNIWPWNESFETGTAWKICRSPSFCNPAPLKPFYAFANPAVFRVCSPFNFHFPDRGSIVIVKKIHVEILTNLHVLRSQESEKVVSIKLRVYLVLCDGCWRRKYNRD